MVRTSARNKRKGESIKAYLERLRRHNKECSRVREQMSKGIIK